MVYARRIIRVYCKVGMDMLQFEKSMNTPSGVGYNMKNFLPVLVVVVLLVIAMGSWYTVDQGERAVILRNGAAIGTAEPGLHFKVPVIDQIAKMSVQSRKAHFEHMSAYSKDQQPAELSISVNYRMNAGQVKDIYANFGSEIAMTERLINPRMFKETKTVFGHFTAVSAIQERERLNHEIYEAIAGSVSGPVTIESVQVENIDFSAAYEQSIEQRMLAEVEVQKVRQNWEREKVQADIVRTKAQADADGRLAQAQAEAKAIELRGQAEASAIRAKGDALRDNPSLVTLIQAERWDGKLPSTMVPGSALPMLNLK